MLNSTIAATKKAMRAAEQQVVALELDDFECLFPAASTAPNRRGRRSSNALSDSSLNILGDAGSTSSQVMPYSAMPTRHVATKLQSSGVRVEQLTRPPFTEATIHGERSVLAEAQQVYKAVAWLRECPSRTLQQLQQRVLNAAENLFVQMVGMPAAVRHTLAVTAAPTLGQAKQKTENDNNSSDDGSDDAVEPAYVMPPAPLTFADFVSNFLREPLATESGATATVVVPPSVLPFDMVIPSGRSQPVAPLTSLHLIYGLHVVEEILRRSFPAASPSTPAASQAAATATAAVGLDEHQALLSEVVHWSIFFESVFDNAREGLCRDPMNFYAAVLLACAERGSWELHNTLDALAEEAVQQLDLSDPSSGRRPDVCIACRTEAMSLAESCRSYVTHTLCSTRTVSPRTRRSGRSARKEGPIPLTRFSLATPAVVWWAAAFVRLFRMHTPVAAPERPPKAETTMCTSSATLVDKGQPGSTDEATKDTISSSEAYFIRDWIAQAAKMDREGFAAQEAAGCLRIPLSCATHAPVAVFGFTQENVDAALGRMTSWMNNSVMADTPLSVAELLRALQDEFAVLPYYISFFKAA